MDVFTKQNFTILPFDRFLFPEQAVIGNGKPVCFIPYLLEEQRGPLLPVNGDRVSMAHHVDLLFTFCEGDDRKRKP